MKIKDLVEIFDSKVDVHWIRKGRFDLAKVETETQDYQIEIEKITLNDWKIPELDGKRIGEILFGVIKEVQTDNSFKTQRKEQNATKIYGVVSNALIDKFSEYDAFYFQVLKRHSNSQEEFETKLAIYQALIRILRQKEQIYSYVANTQFGVQYLISKIKLSSETEQCTGFINPLKEAMMHAGFDVTNFNLYY